jgi:hypothetical protein
MVHVLWWKQLGNTWYEYVLKVIGDPDVYTSYDYSACIREMGHLSGRGRMLRLGISFVKSFSNLISKTEMVRCDEQNFITARRRSLADTAVEFVYYRNFDDQKVSFNCSDGIPVYIPYKQSFIGVENYSITPDIKLLSAKLPIIVRTRLIASKKETEVWIVQNDHKLGAGSLVFQGNVNIGTPNNVNFCITKSNGNTVIYMPSTDQCWFSLTSSGSDSPDIYVICLAPTILYTLEPNLREQYWEASNSISMEYAKVITWGAYGAHYDHKQNSILVSQSLLETGNELFVITSEDHKIAGLSKPAGVFSGLPFVFSKLLEKDIVSKTVKNFIFPTLNHWEVSVADFERLSYKKLPMTTSSRPAMNTIDYGYTSGHVVYRLTFAVTDTSKDANLSVNLRHRGTIYLNEKFVSTHLVYNLGIFRPGSKNGPDNTFGGWQNVCLPKSFLIKGTNSLIILIESFGLNRQPFSFNDIRCPRGIIEASISGVNITEWEIAGVDVRQTSQTYNISGIPKEAESMPTAFSNWQPVKNGVKLDLSGIQGPVWFKGQFDFASLLMQNVKAPVRLNLSGPATCYISINEIIIARYYGNGDGPQSNFYVPDGLLACSENKICILAYRTSAEDAWISLEFDFWRMSEADHWSGNLGTGVPLVLVSSQL